MSLRRMYSMNVLLKKVRTKTLFSIADPIRVEPLELEYLKTAADSLGFNSVILDELFTRTVEEIPLLPDIIVLTGYNVAENQILKEAKYYKKKYPNVKIIVGGVHIQLNASTFHNENIDYVIHSQSLRVFQNVLLKIKGENIEYYGFDYRVNGRWIIGEKEIIHENEDIIPAREFFNNIKRKTYYLDKRNIALIKGSIGCPYKCSYCYCRELNGGKYIKANYKNMAQEINNISADYFWVVDDILFISRVDVLNFIDEIQRLKINKKFIAYLRADFIIRESDLLPKLKEVGLDEVIIGFEAVTEEELKNYNKGTLALDYPKVIELLNKNNIDYTALFMVQGNYGIKDFLKLYKFIKESNIETYTLSIFTPIKGTKEYESQKQSLLTTNPKHFDFLHLVTKSRLPKPIFYLFFYATHIRLLKSKRIRKYILRSKR